MVDTYGRRESFAIEVDWQPGAAKTSAEFTQGAARIFINNETVWHGESVDVGFEWTLIELAEFFANAWPWIVGEQGFPFDLRGGTLYEVKAELSRRWDSKSEAVRQLEQEQLYNYQECHDLAHGIQGAVLPSIWIVRQGNLVWLSSDSTSALYFADEVWEAIQAFVAAVTERAAISQDERSKVLRESWELRENVSQDQALEIATALDTEVRSAVEKSADPYVFWSLAVGDIFQNELVAAARMSATLPVHDISTLLAAIREADYTSLDKLDLLSTAVLAEVPDGTPYDQGYAAAIWLRENLGLTDTDRAEPESTCNGWGIDVQPLNLSVGTVDAVACWGPNHGPTIFVNESGRFARSSAGRRSTLAHEICHLLLDRTGSLPLVEVLGGRSPARVEERARAFAAELLAPREVVGRELSESDDPRRTLVRLKRRYGVSAELIAWQARNSTVMLATSVRAFLRSQVSQPWRY